MMQLLIVFLIQNTIWSVVTSGIVLVLAINLKRRPALIHLGCVIALFAMLTPPLISISVPGQNWLMGNTLLPPTNPGLANASMDGGDNLQILQNAMPDPAIGSKKSTVFETSSQKIADQSVHVVGELPTTSQNLIALVVEAAVEQIRKQQQTPQKILLLCWALGSLTYVIYVSWQCVRFRRIVTRSKPPRQWIASQVAHLSETICSGRCPSIRELDANVSPFVFLSVDGPQLVMPSTLADDLSEEELESLIMHELVHIKRRDPEIRFLELIVAMVFWFNPALWFIRWLLRETEELACDAEVAGALKSKPEIYAAAFLKTIDFIAQDRNQPNSLICAVGGYRSCKRRLEAMVCHLNHVGVSPGQRIAAAMCSIPILLVGFQFSPVAERTLVDSPINDSSAQVDSSRSTPILDAVDDQENQLTTTDIKVMKELSAVKNTANLVFHYRPLDLDEKELANVIRVNQANFNQCEKRLQMKYKGKVHLFLYRDVQDLKKMTGVDAIAFSAGTVSVHQAVDFDSVHELTHIFALQFPRDEDEVTDRFAVEGLATILAETDENVPIHSWAAVYQSASRLPSLVEFRRTWPNGALPGVHPYHLAGSFVGYLIEEYGIEKVKRWYVHSTEAHMEFGKTFRRLERDWLAWLKTQTVDPEHRAHIWDKLGLIPKKFSTEDEGKQIKLFDGKSLSPFQTKDETQWQSKRGMLIGRDDNTWTYLNTQREFPAEIGVRVRFRLLKGKAVTIRLNCTEESTNHVNLATWATYVSATDGGYVGLPNLKIKTGEWNEVVIVNERGTARFYFNDIVIGEYENVFHEQPGTLGVGVEGGIIEIQEFSAIQITEK